MAPEWGAGGHAVANCLETANIIARIEAGLPQQEEWIRRTERHLQDGPS